MVEYTYTPSALTLLASALSGGLLTPEVVNPEVVSE